MKIIYPNPHVQEGVATLSPATRFLNALEGTEEEKLIHIANKDLPTGTPYEIVDDIDIPEDRSFRNAWEYVAGANEKTSADLSLEDQLKYNHITQEAYDAATG